MHSITVILPAYNEELTIQQTIADFAHVLPNAEILVIDNNSKDATNQLAHSAIAKADIKGRVLFEPYQGKGNAVRRAFREVNADIIIMADADCTYPAQEVLKLMQPIVEGRADMVVGDRLANNMYRKQNKRPFHDFGNNLVRTLINKLFDTGIQDVMSGYRVMTREFVKHCPILSEGFEIETEMTLHAVDKRWRVVEIPITYLERPEGSFSKLNTFGDGFRVLKTILKIFKDYKPLPFFGSLAVFFLISGFVAGIPPVLDFIRYQYVYHVPLTVLASSLILFSFLMLSTGISLSTVNKFYRQQYELNLYSLENRYKSHYLRKNTEIK